MKGLHFYFKKIDSFGFLLVVLVILKQLVWMGLLPAWQFPDEQAHFAQVQNFAERKSAKPFFGPNTSLEIYESEKLLGTNRDGSGNNKFTYHPEFKLPYVDGLVGKEELQIQTFPSSYRKEYVMYEATVYPPLYYILVAPFYLLGENLGLLSRIYLVRSANILIFLGTLFFVSRIGKLLFKSKSLRRTLVVLVAFHPMFSFVGAGTTSDNLFNLVFTVGIYLGLRFLHGGITLKNSLMMFFLVQIANWIKPQGNLLGLVFLFPLFAAFIKGSLQQKKLVSVFLILIFGLVFGFVLMNIFLGRQVLPELPTLQGFIRTSNLSPWQFLLRTLQHTYREVIPWYWGVFRWLSLTYPRVVHRIINWVTVACITGLGIWFYNDFRKRNVPTRLPDLFFLSYTAVVYFIGISAYDYLFTRTYHFSFGIQGRYFFPIIVVHLAILLIGCVSLEIRQRLIGKLAKILGGGMIVLHLFAQIFVISSYYEWKNINVFFQQASQYKPSLLKSPYLEILGSAYIISLLLFIWYYMIRSAQTYERT